MGKSSKDNSNPRRTIGIGTKLAIIFVALSILPMAATSYYIVTQTQDQIVSAAGENLLQPGTVALISVILTGTMALIISILLARSITRPIRRLSDAALAVEHDQPFETSDLASIAAGGDEISHLGRVFIDMVLTLRRRMTELRMVYEIGQDITASLEVDETQS